VLLSPGCCPHCQWRVADAEDSQHYGDPEQISSITTLQRTVTAALLHQGLWLEGVDEKLPISFLPGLLVSGVRSGDGLSPIVDCRLVDQLRSAMHRLRCTGEAGAYVGRRVARLSPVQPWLGCPMQLAEVALKRRFDSGLIWESRPSNSATWLTGR
jgi:hypothetical protein